MSMLQIHSFAWSWSAAANESRRNALRRNGTRWIQPGTKLSFSTCTVKNSAAVDRRRWAAASRPRRSQHPVPDWLEMPSSRGRLVQLLFRGSSWRWRCLTTTCSVPTNRWAGWWSATRRTVDRPRRPSGWNWWRLETLQPVGTFCSISSQRETADCMLGESSRGERGVSWRRLLARCTDNYSSKWLQCRLEKQTIT